MRFVMPGVIQCLLICLAGRGVLFAQQSRYSVSEEPAGGLGSPPAAVIRDNTAGVEAAVAPSEGGELSSLRVEFRGAWVELLYRAREYGSASGFRKAPFLWPAVGSQYPAGTIPVTSCGDGTYPIGDRIYPMPCHGFAKGLAWKEAGHTADAKGARVTVALQDSEQTRVNYPFGFVVRVAYEDCRWPPDDHLCHICRRREPGAHAIFDRQPHGVPPSVPTGDGSGLHAV